MSEYWESWKIIMEWYPTIHIVGRLYLVRVWTRKAKRISPWVLVIVPRGMEEAQNEDDN